MSARRSGYCIVWAPLAVGAVAVVALLLAAAPGSEVKAAAPLTPEGVVGFQTTDKLVLTVNFSYPYVIAPAP